jgi:hypothetical protein
MRQKAERTKSINSKASVWGARGEIVCIGTAGCHIAIVPAFVVAIRTENASCKADLLSCTCMAAQTLTHNNIPHRCHQLQRKKRYVLPVPGVHDRLNRCEDRKRAGKSRTYSNICAIRQDLTSNVRKPLPSPEKNYIK